MRFYRNTNASQRHPCAPCAAANDATRPKPADGYRVARIIREKGYKAVSVTFLHSYANPAHELRMKEILEETCVDTDICISYDVLPHYREFERSSTTAVNAYLMPLMRRYLAELSTRVHKSGFGHNLLVMQSNGGLMTVTEAERMPARTVRSGPRGGESPRPG